MDTQSIAATEEWTICRFCFISNVTNPVQYCPVLDFVHTGEILGIKLQDDHDSGIPTKFCNNCNAQIENMRLLRQRARFSEDVWRKYLYRRKNIQLPEGHKPIVHHDLSVNCHLCGCCFNYGELEDHVNSAHKDHIPECDLCQVIFNREDGQNDVDIVLKEEQPADNSQDMQSDEEMPSETESEEADNSSDENVSPDKIPEDADEEEEEEDEEEKDTESSGPLKKKSATPTGQHSCDMCDKSYKRRDSLRSHKRTVHSLDPLACVTCYQQCATRSELYSHIQSVHRFRTAERVAAQSPSKRKFKCSHCTMSFQIESKFKLHLQLHPEAQVAEKVKPTTRMYPCKFCDKFYTRITHLNHHMMKHSTTPFQCEMCDIAPFASRNELRDHEKAVHILKCPQCSKSFDSQEKLAEHILWHTNSKRQCQFCDEFFSLGQLKLHYKTVHEKTLRCSVCHEMFAKKDELDQHIATHDKFSCPICHNEFPTLKGLRLHEVAVHKPTSTNAAVKQQPLYPFRCPKCDKTFNQRNRLNLHMRHWHNEEGFECTVCKKQCSSKSGLQSHMSSHLEKLCPICGKTLNTGSSLKMHMRRHLGERQFKCKVCGKGFPRNSDLVVHTMIHTGEKPFACEVCGMRFSLKNRRTAHMRTHTGEKPYKCTIPGCDLAFAQSGDRTLHVRRHTGDKPFECDQCGERLFTNSLLKTHKKTCKGGAQRT